jgi:hypothetical protein
VTYKDLAPPKPNDARQILTIVGENMPSADKPSILHPLVGANVRTAISHWRHNRPFPLRSLHIRGIAAALIALRFPNYQLEHRRFKKRFATHEPTGGPVFLVGHWRSGTTHLHNLLSQDPRFGHLTFIQAALPWDAMGKFKPARPIMSAVMPETRGMDDVRVSIDTPQEEEMALANMNALSFFNSFYFPKKLIEHYRQGVLLEGISAKELDDFTATYRYLVKKFSYANDGKLLLLKNPANTARLHFLKTTFPNAKFVHIVRNPFEVYASMQKLWKRLFSAFSLQDYAGIDTHPHTLEIYESLTKRFLREQPHLPPEDFIEIRFEDLEKNPTGELERVYDQFQLPQKASALENIQSYADSLSDFRRSKYKLPQSTIDEIRTRWGFALDRWDYQLPESITPTEG